MNRKPFSQWLSDDRGLAPKPARDAASRCIQIQSLLNRPIDEVVSSQPSLDAALVELFELCPNRKDLTYALRLYVLFRNPKLNVRKYAFYGNVNRMS